MLEEADQNNNKEFLKKFGYRSYEGGTTTRSSRIFSIIEFEVRSTWHKSTMGKVLLIIVSIMNFFTILFAATLSSFIGISNRDALNEFVGNYIAFGDSEISSHTDPNIQIFSPGIIGLLLIALFAIAGSGYFADDKNGKVVEIYLSRIAKREYVAGKIGGLLVYVNIFLLGPLLVTCALMIQSLDENHLEYWDFYLGLIIFSLLYSLVVGLCMLTLSTLVEKRQYASLGFFMIFLLGSIIGFSVAENNPDNEFLLLISPSIFLVLLAYVILGDFHLGVSGIDNSSDGFFFVKRPLELNDGAGLEYFHILGLFILYVLFFSFVLSYKINKLTTEEL